RGSLAEHIAADIARHGGILSKEDLAACAAEEAAPLDVSYRGRRFSTVPAPGGGIYVAQALRLLERFDLPALGHNTPAYLRLLAEAMKIATRDKDAHVADPRFDDAPTE